jgi:hypothetical protein
MDWRIADFFGRGLGAEMDPPKRQECGKAERSEYHTFSIGKRLGVRKFGGRSGAGEWYNPAARGGTFFDGLGPSALYAPPKFH